jgi:hypothetical protein
VFIFVNFSFALFTPPLGDYHLPLMRMRDLGAQGANLPSACPRRRRRWQTGQRVEKKARRGERQKARGHGFGRTVHHLHLCTSTLHTYVVVEIWQRILCKRFSCVNMLKRLNNLWIQNQRLILIPPNRHRTRLPGGGSLEKKHKIIRWD